MLIRATRVCGQVLEDKFILEAPPSQDGGTSVLQFRRTQTLFVCNSTAKKQWSFTLTNINAIYFQFRNFLYNKYTIDIRANFFLKKNTIVYIETAKIQKYSSPVLVLFSRKKANERRHGKIAKNNNRRAYSQVPNKRVQLLSKQGDIFWKKS